VYSGEKQLSNNNVISCLFNMENPTLGLHFKPEVEIWPFLCVCSKKSPKLVQT